LEKDTADNSIPFKLKLDYVDTATYEKDEGNKDFIKINLNLVNSAKTSNQ